MSAGVFDRDVLHFRACLIVLCIYYCEYIKSTIVATLEGSDRRSPARRDRLRIHEALNILLRDGLILPAEKTELLRLVQYRNDIAHHIHQVAAGANATPTVQLGVVSALDPSDSEYLSRLRFYADEIVERLETRYRVPFSVTPFLFHETKEAYEAELRRLADKLQRA
jgi:hypothetical protein